MSERGQRPMGNIEIIFRLLLFAMTFAWVIWAGTLWVGLAITVDDTGWSSLGVTGWSLAVATYIALPTVIAACWFRALRRGES